MPTRLSREQEDQAREKEKKLQRNHIDAQPFKNIIQALLEKNVNAQIVVDQIREMVEAIVRTKLSSPEYLGQRTYELSTLSLTTLRKIVNKYGLKVSASGRNDRYELMLAIVTFERSINDRLIIVELC